MIICSSFAFEPCEGCTAFAPKPAATAIVRLLGCRYDADVNMADRWNGTPLTAALRNGHLAIAKTLMSCEAKLGDNADPALAQV